MQSKGQFRPKSTTLPGSQVPACTPQKYCVSVSSFVRAVKTLPEREALEVGVKDRRESPTPQHTSVAADDCWDSTQLGDLRAEVVGIYG